MVSVIVPVYNEEKILLEKSSFFKKLAEASDLIFADGGSTDKTFQLASAYGRVVRTQKSRALQMNYAAGYACCNILIFLHSDNTISLNVLKTIEDKIEEGFIGGCLTQRIDKKGIIYRLLECYGNLRARISKVFYGDQGIFVRKDIFFKLSGFPEVPIFEDVLFSKVLRAQGKTLLLKSKILASPRRWEKKGVIKTILFYSMLTILFYFRFPLHKIGKLYNDVR